MPTARRTLLIVLLAAVALSLVVPALLLGFYALIWARSSSLADYLATVESAATRLPVAVEFEELFPGQTDHFITHYGLNRHGGDRTNTWNSEAYFDGRYSLTMQVEVVVDYENNTVTPAGEPKFYLIEYRRVKDNRDGTYNASSGEGAIFGEKEWREIYRNGGDFSVVDLPIRQDDPIPNMTGFVEGMRRPRIPVISLLDKKPGADEKERGKAK